MCFPAILAIVAQTSNHAIEKEAGSCLGSWNEFPLVQSEAKSATNGMNSVLRQGGGGVKAPKRRMKLILLVLLTLVVVWFWGDFIYSRIVAAQLRKWEATVQRDQNGVRIGCDAFAIGSGDTALLLIHGINDSPKLYEQMAPVLAEKGFRVRAMRLPGFAEPVEQYAKSNRKQWVESVEQEVEALRREGSEQVCIIAHSLGGAIAIAYLLKHPEAVDRVVLLAPAVAVSNRRSILLPVRTWHELGRRTLAFTRITKSPYAVDAHDSEARKYPWMTPFVPLSIVDETFTLLDENQDQAGQIRVPLMMVLSKDDQVVDWLAAEEFFEQSASNEKRLRFMDDAGHTIPFDRGWQELTEEIAEFCQDK
jgi:esterase/lipase